MRLVYGAPCPTCDVAPLLRLDTRDGRLVETLERGCRHVRFKMRVCRDCPASIAHRAYQASLCEPCVERAEREARVRSQDRNRESIRARGRVRAFKKRAADRDADRTKRRERYQRERVQVLAKRKAERRWSNPAYQRTLANNRASTERNREARNQKQRDYRARKRAEREAATRPPVQQQFNRAA